MNILITLLLIVLVLSICTYWVILLQRPRGRARSGFWRQYGESLFGARAGNLLTKATVVLGIVFMVSALFLGVLFAQKDRPLMSQASSAKADASTLAVENTAATSEGVREQ